MTGWPREIKVKLTTVKSWLQRNLALAPSPAMG